MKLALFAEIPVPKPWTKGKEQRIFQETIQQAVFAEQMGFHSFWTVEHHFLSEMSHATNLRFSTARSRHSPRRCV
jgi:alkanesulfonate monooxygenase SsuD/methylene tetrahydromethanopterin reductase-like flavin-dependent oxidoreductase (luciferase family)